LIDQGKPGQKGAKDSYNGKFRGECLSLECFRGRAEAKVVMATWRRHYDGVRAYSTFGYLTPTALAARTRRPVM